MEDNDVYELPIQESKVGKYKQYLIKLPKQLTDILQIGKGDKFKIEIYPLEATEDHPKFDIKVIRNDKENTQATI